MAMAMAVAMAGLFWCGHRTTLTIHELRAGIAAAVQQDVMIRARTKIMHNHNPPLPGTNAVLYYQLCVAPYEVGKARAPM